MSSADAAPRRSLLGLVRSLGDRWDRSPWVFNATGAVLAMAVGASTAFEGIPGKNPVTLLWFAVIVLAVFFLVTGPYLLARRAERVEELTQRISQLEEELGRVEEARSRDRAELKSVLDGVGRDLLKECDIDADDTRISFYQHHAEEKKFALVGRASRNPTLCQRGRPSYPDDVGIIAKAWQEETATDRVWFSDPEKWASYQERAHGMDRAAARRIHMKSLSFLGVRIDDGDQPFGILVIESKNRDRVTPEHAETVRSHGAFSRIQAMLHVAPKLPLERAPSAS